MVGYKTSPLDVMLIHCGTFNVRCFRSELKAVIEWLRSRRCSVKNIEVIFKA